MCEALRELMKDEIEEEKAKAIEAGRAEGIEAGRAEGIEAGRAQGIEQGIAQGEANIIRIMYDNGNSFEQIATYTGKNPDDVKAIVEGNAFPFLS